MLVLRGFSRPAPEATALTIGNFDGVHCGHRALLARLCQRGNASLLPAVLTFEPHPREFFCPTVPARLTTLREKLEHFAEEGIALTRVLRFDAALAALTAQTFIERVLAGLMKVRVLVIGDDFRFGATREGDFDALCAAGAQHGFCVERVESVRVNGERVSSSTVREALADGQMERAARLLGRPYAIDGRIVRGEQMGRQLGFATANIRIRHDNPPLSGVFAVEVGGLPDGPRQGVANIGIRPSVNCAARPLLEVHLFDFRADIYGAHLNVRFVHKLRSEQHFPTVAALQTQIARDVESARQYFRQEQAHG